MDYSAYQIEDLLTDDSFIAYCYNEDEISVTKWEDILAAAPQLSQRVSDARELCLLMGIKVGAAEKAIALQRLKHAVDTAVEYTGPTSKIVSIRDYITKWVAIAATLIMMAGAFAVYKFNASPSGAALYSAATDANYRLVGKTDFGHRKLIRLPDGSLAMLNGSSTLKIANDYNENNRHLLLVGEAFFSVTKNKHKPFVVITGKTATTALGTSFKVESYPDSKVASVMLSTGKVKVECTEADRKVEDVLLIPGQKAALFNGDKAFTQTTFYAKDLQNWIDRKLVFKGADLGEISAKIKALYGVVIAPVYKAGNGVSFTGEFSGKDVGEVLDAIGFTNHFTYTQSGNTVQLKF